MSLTFCPNCGNLLALERRGVYALTCGTCPYAYKLDTELRRTVPLVRKEMEDVLGGPEAWKNVQKTEAVCPKCSHGLAYFREVQTRSADEPATLFFRCCECETMWKEG